MANKLQSTGDIKISQAASALGRSNSLSDYYADVIGTDNFVDNPAVDEESFGLHPSAQAFERQVAAATSNSTTVTLNTTHGSPNITISTGAAMHTSGNAFTGTNAPTVAAVSSDNNTLTLSRAVSFQVGDVILLFPPISLGDLYGDANVDRFVISSNQQNLNLRVYLHSLGWDLTSRAFVTINSGVYITGSARRSTTNQQIPALLIDGNWPNGLFIINNGNILGHGGDGSGRSSSNSHVKKGSCAIKIDTPALVNIENNGVIAGGGGGGAASNSTGGSANSGGGGGAGGGNGGAGKPNSGGKTHSGNGGTGANNVTGIGLKGGNGNSASGDVQGKGGDAGGSGGGYKNAT